MTIPLETLNRYMENKINEYLCRRGYTGGYHFGTSTLNGALTVFYGNELHERGIRLSEITNDISNAISSAKQELCEEFGLTVYNSKTIVLSGGYHPSNIYITEFADNSYRDDRFIYALNVVHNDFLSAHENNAWSAYRESGVTFLGIERNGTTRVVHITCFKGPSETAGIPKNIFLNRSNATLYID